MGRGMKTSHMLRVEIINHNLEKARRFSQKKIMKINQPRLVGSRNRSEIQLELNAKKL